ncbi:MAG: TIGR04282 family arsenosugar biosynthesis glycosyltransferase [Promethearchaeota archaeon]
MNKNSLIILIRNPKLGCVKTRLAAKIGDEDALKVYKALLDYTKSITSEINSSRLLFYSNFIDDNDLWDNGLFKKFLQVGNSFGSRMCNAFKIAFKNHEKAVIIGSDCDELSPKIIRDAFNKLSKFDVVLGPAKDGGYYLMGLTKIYPELFMNKKWSTSSVLNDTLEDIKKLGLSYYLLPVLSDIDDFEDFKNSKLYKKIILN